MSATINENRNTHFLPAENKKPIAAKKLTPQMPIAAASAPEAAQRTESETKTQPVPVTETVKIPASAPVPDVENRPAEAIQEEEKSPANPETVSRQAERVVNPVSVPEPEVAVSKPEEAVQEPCIPEAGMEAARPAVPEPTANAEAPEEPEQMEAAMLEPEILQAAERAESQASLPITDDQDRPGSAEAPVSDALDRPDSEVVAEGPVIPPEQAAAPTPNMNEQEEPERPPIAMEAPIPDEEILHLRPELVEEKPSPEVVAAEEEPEAPEDSFGFIEVQTATSDGAIPIPDVKVTLTKREIGGEERLLGYGLTNQNGQAEIFEVPAPAASYSEQPSDMLPFAQYDVKVEKEGFYTIVIRNVQAFGGETSLQQIEMLPLPEFATNAVVEYDVLPQEL